VHISAAYNKALVGIYQDSLKNNQLWSPGYSNGHQISLQQALAVQVV
jgi:ADP-heptose:LPS heptosyltransferase